MLPEPRMSVRKICCSVWIFLYLLSMHVTQSQSISQCKNNLMYSLLPVVALITNAPNKNCVQIMLQSAILEAAVLSKNKSAHHSSEHCTPLWWRVLAFGIHSTICLFLPKVFITMVYLIINEISVGITESLTRERFPTTKTFGLAAAHMRNYSSHSSCLHSTPAFSSPAFSVLFSQARVV